MIIFIKKAIEKPTLSESVEDRSFRSDIQTYDYQE